VAGVHKFQYARGRFVFRIEERREEVCRRGLANQPIDVPDEGAEVQVGMRSLCPEGSQSSFFDVGGPGHVESLLDALMYRQ